MHRNCVLALTTTLAVIVAGLLTGCGEESSTGGAPAGLDSSAEIARDDPINAPTGFTSTQGGAGEPDGAPLPAAAERKVVRTATLELSVDSVGASVQEVENVAAAAGGFVSGSSVFVEGPPMAGEESVRRTQTGSVTIRVPADAYTSVLQQLRGIAKEVVSETSNAEEVTDEYTDLQARLRNLEATENRYLELLNQATGIPDILTVQDRLSQVRGEIEAVQGRINVINELTALATITVQLTPLPLVKVDSDRHWATAAWEESWDVSKGAVEVLGSVAIASAVLLVWLAVFVPVSAIMWRLFGRRAVVLARKMYDM